MRRVSMKFFINQMTKKGQLDRFFMFGELTVRVYT